jgi:hypothetical protein
MHWSKYFRELIVIFKVCDTLLELIVFRQECIIHRLVMGGGLPLTILMLTPSLF